MELPVAPQTYAPTAEALVRALHRVDVMLARTAAQEGELPGALAFTNPRRPAVAMVNCALEVDVPKGSSAGEAVGAVEAHFAQAGVPCHSLQVGAASWPPELVQALEQRGYRRGPQVSVYVLDRFVAPKQPCAALQVIPGRAAYVELREFYTRAGQAQGLPVDAVLAQDLADTRIDHLDEPRLEVLLGRIEGRPAGAISLVNLGDVGVIDDIATLPPYRGRGVAATLLDRAIELARRSVLKHVILECQPDNPATRLYEAMGFKAVASHCKYVRG